MGRSVRFAALSGADAGQMLENEEEKSFYRIAPDRTHPDALKRESASVAGASNGWFGNTGWETSAEANYETDIAGYSCVKRRGSDGRFWPTRIVRCRHSRRFDSENASSDRRLRLVIADMLTKMPAG